MKNGIIPILFLSGRKSEAAAAVPQSYLDATSLIGDEVFVKDRLQAYKDVGVTCLNASFAGQTTDERIRHCDSLRNIIEKI